MRVSEGLLVESTAEIITRETPALDRPLLDAVAAASFRTAAVRLAREPPQSEFANEAADQAAQALLSLATSRDESALRQILRPDPGMGDTTWTVACYQIGDLTPCALLDFANPVSAVTTLARCEEASHVAAELVASNPTGTRWTALIRTGKAVRFQLPDDRSASGATRENPGEMSLADRHWRDQLKRWATDGGSSEWASATPSARPVKVPQAPSGSRPSHPLRPELRAPERPELRAPERPAPAGLEHALELVLDALRSVEVRTQPTAGQSNDEVLRRLDDLDRRMSEFQATVGMALEQRMQGLANYTAELARGFAAQQNATTARLEARLDELLARLPGDGADPDDLPDPADLPER